MMLSQPSWKTYTNSRFGFSIRYPAGVLRPEAPPQNGDGLQFLSSDKTAELRVWGDLNVLGDSIKTRYEAALRDVGGKASYKVLREDWFVISGSKAGREFYKKVMFGKEGTVRTLWLEYPVTGKKRFDPIVEGVVRSFKVAP